MFYIFCFYHILSVPNRTFYLDVSSDILLTMAITLLFVNKFDNTIRIQKVFTFCLDFKLCVIFLCEFRNGIHFDDKLFLSKV